MAWETGTPDYWWTHVTLHELFYTLGASQYPISNPAPFASVGAHCLDGIDMLCYDDGTSPGYSETRCPANGFYDSSAGVPIDCGYDTYLDTETESGEWLSTFWNLGGVENPYFTEREDRELEIQASSKQALRDYSNWNQWIYYPGSNGQLCLITLELSGWGYGCPQVSHPRKEPSRQSYVTSRTVRNGFTTVAATTKSAS